MNKKQLALLQAARISVAVWEKASKEDVSEDDFKTDIEDYTNTQLQYWKDKHPDYTPEKIKEMERTLRNEGEARAIRKMVKDFDLTEAEVKDKTPEEVAAIAKAKLGKAKPDDELAKALDQYKTKATTLEAELEKIQKEIIPGIHNEYKAKEAAKIRHEKLMGLFTTLPVIDEYKTDFPDILNKRIQSVGIEAKLNDKNEIEFYDKDGTKAKNKTTGKDLTADDFRELVKPTLKGYLKESNADADKKKEEVPGGRKGDLSESRQRLLERNKEMREATLAGK